MAERLTLKNLTEDMAEAVPLVDAETTGQYGDGLGSEDEERQISLLLEHLRGMDERYRDVGQEVTYPDTSEKCDLVLPTGEPIEAKLIRYWRANGDPEPNMYRHVFSPFHRNTMMSDAKRLSDSDFDGRAGLLGLFYTRSDEDSTTVEALPERYTAEDIADKIARDIDYWYGIDVSVCQISHFSGLQHDIHEQGAVLSWEIE